MKQNNFQSALRMALAAVLMVFTTMAFAQTAVKGTVIDAANGEPIIGASILEMGTTNGTITDWDGNFTLTVAPGAKLQISYMGYKTQELEAKPVMNVKLGEDSELLDEVVVVGYGVVKKNDATGSVTAIKPDEMNKGLQTNAQDMIAGKIAGVNITTDGGTPGGGASIRIRGGSSLNASNDPLIVIDGLAIDNGGAFGSSNILASINPADIETFTVLKDASATAIYGSRASNGVIQITTKKGKSGSKLKVSYDGNVSVGAIMKRQEVMTGDQIRAYAIASGQSEYDNRFLMNCNTDWQDQIYRPAVSTDHNISLMGGYKDNIVDMPYRASVGYTLNNGAIKTSQFQRVTASLNLNPTFLDNHLMINFNAKGMYNYNQYEPGVSGAALDMSPTVPVTSKGDLTNIYGQQVISKEELDQQWGGYFQETETNDSKYGPYNDPTWPLQQRTYSTANPVALLYQQQKRSNAVQFIGNLAGNYKVHGFEDLMLSASFGTNVSYGKIKSMNKPNGATNHYYGWNGWEDKIKYNNQFNATAQYGHDWEDAGQHFDIMAGYEWQHYYNSYRANGSGMYPITNMDPELAGGPYNSSGLQTGAGENYIVSFFGRANWIAWNQLMVTVNFRADGSSRFSRKNRWGLFPAVALGWKIKETFLQDVNAVNDLKLRLGYGITGQQDGIGDYSYMPGYTSVKEHAVYYPVGDQNYAHENEKGEIVNVVKDVFGNTLYVSTRPDGYNPDLTWEKTTTYNVGIDYAFLNNRISGSLEYYFRNTTDLLNNRRVAMGTNYRSYVMSNIGSLQNQGVEFAINAVVLDYGKKFKWDLGYNVTWNQNKITKLNGEDKMVDGWSEAGVGNGGTKISKFCVGYASNTYFLYQARTALDENGNKYWYIVDRQKEGEEGYGKIDDNDKVLRHTPVAPVNMGFQTKFQFYNFDLGICFRAAIGNYVFNNTIATRLQNVEVGSLSKSGYYHNLLTSVFQTYYDEGYTKYIHAGQTTSTLDGGEYAITDKFLENASFLRCDNITLGYSFAPKNAKITGRAYCTVSNPFVITKYSGLDPEVGMNGVDNAIYPRSMTTVLGINLQF